MEDLRNGTGWYASPNKLDLDKSISKAEKAVWHNFAAHTNTEGGDCFPSAKTQAQETGFSVNLVCAARQSLIEKGWLEKKVIQDKSGKIVRYQWTTRVPRSAPTPAPAPVATTLPVPSAKEVEGVADIIHVFSALNPAINYGNKTERTAAATLISKIGFERTLNAAQYAVLVQGDRFAPRITRPRQLLDKLGELSAHKLKEDKKTDLPRHI